MAEHMPMRDALLATCLATTSIFASTSVLADTCDNIEFEAAEEYYVTAVGQFSAFIRCVAAADVDGDGAPDVLASDRYGEEIRILLNDGSGGLGYPVGSVLAAGCEREPDHHPRGSRRGRLGRPGFQHASAGAAVFLNLGEDSTGKWLGFSGPNHLPFRLRAALDRCERTSTSMATWTCLFPTSVKRASRPASTSSSTMAMERLQTAFWYNLGFNARCISIIGCRSRFRWIPRGHRHRKPR